MRRTIPHHYNTRTQNYLTFHINVHVFVYIFSRVGMMLNVVLLHYIYMTRFHGL